MPLETAQYINQLDAANPLGSDPIAAGDDHLRLIKAAIKATFPNITGPVNLTQADINDLLKKAGGTMTGPLVLSGNASNALEAVPKQQLDSVIAGLGTLSSQNANAVAVTGGSINGTPIGASAASTVNATTVTATSVVLGSGWSVLVSGGKLVFSNNGTVRASLDASGNFTVTGNVTGFGTP